MSNVNINLSFVLTAEVDMAKQFADYLEKYQDPGKQYLNLQKYFYFHFVQKQMQ